MINLIGIWLVMVLMSEFVAQRERAKNFSEQVKHKLGSDVDWEGELPPSLKFVARAGKKAEMRLEYITADDKFDLYDRDVKTRENKNIGSYSPTESSPDEVVTAIRTYIG